MQAGLDARCGSDQHGVAELLGRLQQCMLRPHPAHRQAHDIYHRQLEPLEQLQQALRLSR